LTPVSPLRLRVGLARAVSSPTMILRRYTTGCIAASGRIRAD